MRYLIRMRVAAVGLLAVGLGGLAGLGGCLPVAVGDPEKAKVDEKFLGGWIVAEDQTRSTLYLVSKFDERAYLVQVLKFEVKNNKAVKAVSATTMKAWTTTLGKNEFVCADFIVPEKTLGLGAENAQKIFYVAAVAVKGDELTLRATNMGGAAFKEIKTREAAEKLLSEHAEDEGVLGEAVTLKRIGKGSEEALKAILKAFAMAPE